MTRFEMEKIETEALYKNIIPVFLMALSGLVFGYLSNSSAITLDGLFSTVLFLTMLLAIYIKKQATKPKSFLYPHGKFQLETLYILFKILILMGILIFSFTHSVITILEYVMQGEIVEEVDQFFANMYYVTKIMAFLVAYFIYSSSHKKTKNKSEVLKLEKTSILIDGSITIGILLGFIILGSIEMLAPISDAIILFVLSIVLFVHITHSFLHELEIILGKRMEIPREDFYRGLFNHYFAHVNFSDVYIRHYGKLTLVSLTCTYTGSRTVQELNLMEKEIKKLMYDEYDKVHLDIYWNKCKDGECCIYEKDEE